MNQKPNYLQHYIDLTRDMDDLNEKVIPLIGIIPLETFARDLKRLSKSLLVEYRKQKNKPEVMRLIAVEKKPVIPGKIFNNVLDKLLGSKPEERLVEGLLDYDKEDNFCCCAQEGCAAPVAPYASFAYNQSLSEFSNWLDNHVGQKTTQRDIVRNYIRSYFTFVRHLEIHQPDYDKYLMNLFDKFPYAGLLLMSHHYMIRIANKNNVTETMLLDIFSRAMAEAWSLIRDVYTISKQDTIVNTDELTWGLLGRTGRMVMPWSLSGPVVMDDASLLSFDFERRETEELNVIFSARYLIKMVEGLIPLFAMGLHPRYSRAGHGMKLEYTNSLYRALFRLADDEQLFTLKED